MIYDKKTLRDYLKSDMSFYYNQSRRERFLNWLTGDPVYFIAKYIRLLRKEEYFYNKNKTKIDTILYLLYFRRKNILGNKLGFKIPKNCFGLGLTIYHHGEIIVNENVRVGTNCRMHGDNCIGNDGINDEVPCIGDGLDLGIGAKIIGDVELGNNIRVGANAVVTKSFVKDNLTLVGCPAQEIIRREV